MGQERGARAKSNPPCLFVAAGLRRNIRGGQRRSAAHDRFNGGDEGFAGTGRHRPAALHLVE